MTTTATRERPILFSGPMVRAILDGRKSQTRRVVKPQPVPIPSDVWQSGEHDNGWWWAAPGVGMMVAVPDMGAGLCPYGRPGDRLWVREKIAHSVDEGKGGHCCIVYGDMSAQYMLCEDDGEGDPIGLGGVCCNPWLPDDLRWKPSIHMPRWASRLTLEVVSVRVERVRDISEADAVAEGRSLTPGDPRGYFPETWDAINGKRGIGWDANPWVWAVEFKVVR